LVSEQTTRKVVKRLLQADFTQAEAKGQTKWSHPTGVHIASGYRTISPGVVRQVNKAIEESEQRR
jgi:hypothetical protein